MYLIWYYLLCICAAFIMAVLFEKKFEEAIVMVLLGVIVVLYFFYVLDILDIGFRITCIVFGFGLMCSIYKILKCKKIKQYIELVFRPSAIIYFIALLLIYLTVRQNTVKLIDELHLWAAMPKILFYHGGENQLKLPMLMGYQAYIPGVPLWLYFLEKLNRVFSEPLLYFGYGALGVTLLLPACSKVLNYKKWYTFPILAIGLYAVPLLCYNGKISDLAIYYRSLFVDPILGIAVGYGTWLLVHKPWSSINKMINFSLCSSLVVLIKSSGIAFVGVWIISIFFYLCIYEKQIFKRWYIWAGTIFPFAIWLIWKVCCDIFATKDMFDYSVADIFNLSYMKVFLTALATKNIIWPRLEILSPYCTFLSVMLWMILSSVTWWLIVRKQLVEKSKQIKWAFITLIIQVVVFTLGLYGLCVGPLFQSSMPSYARYISTAVTAFGVFMFMNLVYEFNALLKCFERLRHRKQEMKLGILFILEVVIGALCYPSCILRNYIANRGVEDGARVEKIVADYPVEENEYGFVKSVLLVDNKYTLWWPLCRRLYFDLIDDDILCDGVYFEEDIINEINSENVKILTLPEGRGWDNYAYIYRIHGADDDPARTVETFEVVKIDDRDIWVQRIEEQKIE